MGATRASESPKHQTTVERKSERERVVTRTFDAPARLVFDAWTKPELMKRWWVPRSIPMSLVSCEMDVRTGGTYKLTFKMEPHPPMDFFGRYVEVVPNRRLVWTNEESGADASTTTVTFEEKDGMTTVVVSELYPSKEALEADGAHEAAKEVHAQLDALLAALRADGVA
ncbi:MAG: SRPBCC domain-containing protein [Anaeromyxobacteraceae bacterium]